MASELITNNIWLRLTTAVKTCKTKSFVAVAYFGTGGASMLPLSEGSYLVVDASEKAVKSGQTNPTELLKLYKKGIEIYSHENLHAKLFVIGGHIYIGSTNVSRNSSNVLEEVLYKTSDKQAVADAKAFIKSICLNELGPERLKKLEKMYRPSQFTGSRLPKSKAENKKKSLPVLHQFNLLLDPWNEEERKQGAIGLKEAKKKRINYTRHHIDEFIYTGQLIAKEGDIALQVVDEGKVTYVSPPGTIINIRKWTKENRRWFVVFIEVPDKKRKNIEWIKKQCNKKELVALKRNGKKSIAYAEKMRGFWK